MMVIAARKISSTLANVAQTDLREASQEGNHEQIRIGNLYAQQDSSYRKPFLRELEADRQSILTSTC